MHLATDVAYADDAETTSARAAGVLFVDWADESPADTLVQHIERVEPYVPGAFYRRELPCIWPLVETAGARGPLTVVIVDGFVDLGPDRPGLGRHLYDRLRAAGIAAAVVGVAKSAFREAPAVPVRRGGSTVPLWVTAAGMTADEAAARVSRMHGPFRLPTLLKRVDQVANGVLD